MFKLKKISKEGIPEALDKAERYRLLNEPWLAESICFDVLEAEPENNKALVVLLLAITDQFGIAGLVDVKDAQQILSRLPDEYQKEYYGGIICERQGKAILNRTHSHNAAIAYDWFYEAMNHYEKAEAIRPPGNDDAILRWNTCARLIKRYHLEPREEEYIEPPLE